jgi:hypothetical protein
MQDRDHADLGAEMFGIGADGADRLGHGLEEDIVDGGLVVKGDRGDRRRQREHGSKRLARARPGARRATLRGPAPGTPTLFASAPC